MNTVDSIIDNIGINFENLFWDLVTMAIIVAVATMLSKLLRRRFELALSEKSFGRNGAVLAGRLLSLSIYGVAGVLVLASFGVSWSGLMTFLAAFTVALGLSLQDVLKNFFSGILLLMERPFKVGDFIRVREVEGEVQGIDVRTTLVKIHDGSVVMIPNALVFTEIVTKRSKSGTRRVDLNVVATGKSIAETERVFHTVLMAIPGVVRPIPAPIVKVASYSETTFDLSILLEDSRETEQQVLEALVHAVDDESIKVTRL